MGVSSGDSIWGSMLTFAYCVKKKRVFYDILRVHPNLLGNMAYLWPCLGTLSRLQICSTSGCFFPLLETVGGWPDPVLDLRMDEQPIHN